MKRWWFLLTWVLVKIGRRPSLSILMYLAEFKQPSHTTSSGLSIMPNCTPNQYRKATMFNCWLQSIHPKFLIRWSPHPYTTTAWELGEWGLIREDHSLPKVQWFLDHILDTPVSPGYVGWLEKWLASRCSTFVPKSSKVSSDWWYTQLHLLWQIRWLRFEVPSPLISEGFWGILLMAQDDQNGLLQSPWLRSWIGWWHGSQWTVEWTDSSIFVADLHQPLPDQQFSPSENLWVPKNPVTEACWFTLWCIIPQYIAHSNH